VSGAGEWPGWRRVETSWGEDGWHVLTARCGATSAEVATGMAGLPASVLADAVVIDRAGAGVALWFRNLPPVAVPSPGPDGSDAPTEAATVPPAATERWVPELGPATGPDHGLTPFDLAVSELLRAARDDAAGALIMTMVRLVPPPAVVALGELVRDARHGRCSCGS